MSADKPLLDFRPVDTAAMEQIYPYLQLHTERSCDFTYGGILMWVDMFGYEYAIHADTLFIKGLAPSLEGEHTEGKVAFSVPLGRLPLCESVELLKEWCLSNGTPLLFSSVTPLAADALMECGAAKCEELPSWEDYIYDAHALATLAGKKLSKKRNHTHQFENRYPDWSFSFLTPGDVAEIREVVNRTVAREAAQTVEARRERSLADMLLTEMEHGNPHMLGGVLRAEGEVVAYTIGDIMGDTLHIHVEKAERSVAGSFEMINNCFAKAVTDRYPHINFINREDDAGDPGLRAAKQSYHPLYLLKKYNVYF